MAEEDIPLLKGIPIDIKAKEPKLNPRSPLYGLRNYKIRKKESSKEVFLLRSKLMRQARLLGNDLQKRLMLLSKWPTYGKKDCG